KIIQDPLNGPIKLSGLYEELLDTPEMQRLRYVKSLGLCYLVFPGANHTRFEHSLGVMNLARDFAHTLELEDTDIAAVSGLLHDVGHPPMSHGVERFFQDSTGMDHLEAGVRIVRGKPPFESSRIPDILDSHGIDPGEVTQIMKGKSSRYPIHSKIVSGPIDVDEMDYLRRDSLFCGVKLGLIDERRIMNIAKTESSDLVIEEKGIPAVESVLIARILMYNSVYFHKTCRIAQIMMEKALELASSPPENPFNMGDHDLLAAISKDEASRKLVGEIMQRKLFKPLARVPYSKEKESGITRKLGSNYNTSDFIVDVIPPLSFSGIDRVKSDLRVVTGKKTYSLEGVSPLVRALYETLEIRTINVSSREGIRDEVLNDLVEFT
ncbi:MAG TPA: HD domain-containing protein, partial [Thermoplasmataceae archaeon]|nr:HD domain-containing protein [Thermoplasmataceae archaeon]